MLTNWQSQKRMDRITGYELRRIEIVKTLIDKNEKLLKAMVQTLVNMGQLPPEALDDIKKEFPDVH